MNSSLGIELYKSLKLDTNLSKIVDIFGKLKIDLRKIEDDNHIKRMSDLRIKRQRFLGKKHKMKTLEENKENENKENKENNEVIKYIKEQEILLEDNIINLNLIDHCDFILKSGLNTLFNNIVFYGNVMDGLPIEKNSFNTYLIESDDNSYYKCLSLFLYGTMDHYLILKKEVTGFCQDNINEIFNMQNEIEIREGVFLNTKDYIKGMDSHTYIAPDIDLTISSYLYDINIAIYVDSLNESVYDNFHSYIYEEEASNNPLMILHNQNHEHYDLLYPRDISLPYSEKVPDNNSVGKKIRPFPNGINPYPPYTFGKDRDLYLNIFNFLFDGVINGRRTWPDYIENNKNISMKNNMKSYFYRKVGLSKSHKNPFSKKETDAIKEIYSIENNRLYVIRYEYNNNYEKKLLIRKYMIPYHNEINYILNKYHDKTLDLEGNINTIKKNNFYWVGMAKDIGDFLIRLYPDAKYEKQLAECLPLEEENRRSRSYFG